METPEKQWLLGLSLQELTEVAASAGLKRFAGAQIAGWIYPKYADSIEAMTNISVRAREIISQGYEVGRIAPSEMAESGDGTRKYLFPTRNGRSVETVYIPDGDRATLCISSQAGCRMGCHFCMTARGGYGHNLSAGEIINQIVAIPEREKLTNIVYMGMGEPLDNLDNVLRSIEIMTSEWGYGWSPTRITLSTIGVIPNLKKFLDLTKVHLAVSLHNPFDGERAAIMPMQKAYPIAGVLEILAGYDFSHQRRLSFEYIMFDGVNDTDRHLAELIRILSPLHCRVNLIRFHAIPGCDLKGTPDKRIKEFNAALNKAGITTTTRNSRGEDIFAACGMLAGKKNTSGSGKNDTSGAGK